MVFKFYIGGYFGESFQLEWLADGLLCQTEYQREAEYKEPSDIFITLNDDPQWKAVIDYLSTQNWEAEYISPALDGTQWELEVVTDKVNIKSRGSNAFPSGFKDFLKPLNKVMARDGITIY